MNKRRHDIPALHVLKAICALFVIIIHTPFFPRLSNIYPFLQIAVPCFFLITGYFLYSPEAAVEKARLKRWLAKVLAITFFLNTFYMGLELGIGYCLPWRLWLVSLFTGGVCGHLWYLSALWEALLILLVLLHWGGRRYVPYLPVLFIAYAVCAYSASSLARDGCHYLNGIIIALPMIGTGYAMAAKEKALVSWRHVPLLFAVCLALSYTESCLLPHWGCANHSLYAVFVLPCAACVLLIALKHRDFSPPAMAWIGKRHSANIYYFHPAVSGSLNWLALHFCPGLYHRPVHVLFVFAFSILFSCFLQTMWKCGMGLLSHWRRVR